MTEYGTIKIPKEEYDDHNERRQDLGLTWAEYIDGEAPDAPDADIGLSDDLRDQLDRIEAAASTAESRTGSIESTLEELGGR